LILNAKEKANCNLTVVERCKILIGLLLELRLRRAKFKKEQRNVQQYLNKSAILNEIPGIKIDINIVKISDAFQSYRSSKIMLKNNWLRNI